MKKNKRQKHSESRVQRFTNRLENAYTENNDGENNISDNLTKRFYEDLICLCQEYDCIYDSPWLWDNKLFGLFSNFKLLLLSEELKVSFLPFTIAKKRITKKKYTVANKRLFAVPRMFNRVTTGLARYQLVVDKSLTNEQIEENYTKMIRLIEYDFKYHKGKLAVIQIDLNNPEVKRPRYIK